MKRFGKLILVAVLTFCAVFSSFADTKTDIANSRKNITSNKQKIEDIKKEQAEVKSKISELSGLKNDVAKYVEELDQELTSLQGRIESLTAEIGTTKEEIAAVETSLSEARELEKEQEASMKLRIKYTYEAGDSDFFEAIFSSGSIADILNRVEYVQRVSRYDRDKLEEFTELREQIAAKEEELSEALALLEEQEAALSEDKAEVEAAIAKKSEELKSYEAKLSAANAEMSELSDDVKKLNAAIAAEENAIKRAEEEERRREEEARKKAEASGQKYEKKSIGSISFSWPCPASSRISSYFGDRESPTAGASTNHKGIDIAASSGSNILAAAGGTVTIATYSQSAGNYVMVSHGGGVCTVYMHMKSIAVSVGQEVSKGTVLGYVGSTGYSTGPHLHFGIRVDGTYVNPLSYVSP